jgi:hypothetical protein
MNFNYLSDQTIVRIQIPVNDILGVEVGHARSNVFRKVSSLLPRKRFVGVLDQVSQGAAWNELGDQVEALLLVENANETQHIVMVETS